MGALTVVIPATYDTASAVAGASSRVDAYEPGDRTYWDDLYGRLSTLRRAPA